MHPRTIATIEQLRQGDWFGCVGVVDTQVAEVLSSWDEAVASCGSLEWENLLLEAANQYCERLFERSRERFNKWNEVVAEIKPAAIELAGERTKDVIEAHKLPKVFRDTVEWDIVQCLMESEYADVYPPGFFASQAYWYIKGHFPCGWHGEFPEGKLVIY